MQARARCQVLGVACFLAAAASAEETLWQALLLRRVIKKNSNFGAAISSFHKSTRQFSVSASADRERRKPSKAIYSRSVQTRQVRSVGDR